MAACFFSCLFICSNVHGTCTLLMKRLITLKIHYNAIEIKMNEWNMSECVSQKEIHLRTYSTVEHRSWNRSPVWLNWIRITMMPVHEEFEDTWIVEVCTHISCWLTLQLFHLNAVHIRERVQWMAHNGKTTTTILFFKVLCHIFKYGLSINSQKCSNQNSGRTSNNTTEFAVWLCFGLFCFKLLSSPQFVDVCISPHNNAIALII